MKRFETRTEIKVMKALSKVLMDADEPLTESQISASNLNVIEPSQIMMVIGKTDESKASLMRFVEGKNFKNHTINGLETMTYTEASTGLYPGSYISMALNILMATNDTLIDIATQDSKPSCLENKYFKIWIAPALRGGC